VNILYKCNAKTDIESGLVNCNDLFHALSQGKYNCYKCKGPGSSVWDLCKLPGSCQGSDPGSNLGKLLESGGNPGEIPVSGLSGESGST